MSTSDFVNTSGGMIFKKKIIGAVTRNGPTVFVHNDVHELLGVLKFDSVEEAEAELANIYAQLNAPEPPPAKRQRG